MDDKSFSTFPSIPPKPSGKPSGEKEEVYVRVESESGATKETFHERKKSAVRVGIRSGEKKN